MEANKHFLGALLLLAALAMVHHVSATDHVVGGDRGLTRNPSSSLTGSHLDTRRISTTLFNVQVNQLGYDNCTTDNAIGNWSSGKDFMFLNVSNRYYYIDGRGGCYSGMKITFLVENLAPPTHHSILDNATTKDSGVSDIGCELRPVGLIVSVLFMLVAALFGF